MSRLRFAEVFEIDELSELPIFEPITYEKREEDGRTVYYPQHNSASVIDLRDYVWWIDEDGQHWETCRDGGGRLCRMRSTR